MSNKKENKKIERKNFLSKKFKNILLTISFAILIIIIAASIINVNKKNFAGKAIDYQLENIDFSDYPHFMIEGGKLNADIVLGDNAPPEDVISAIDIATSIKYLGSSNQYTIIEVGTAKLASEINDISAQNLLLIGNSLTNPLVGHFIPSDSWYLYQGQAMIRLFQNGDHFALVVGGTEVMDTRRAAKALANFEDFYMEGEEICVTGTTLYDINVDLGRCIMKKCSDSDDGLDYLVKGRTCEFTKLVKEDFFFMNVIEDEINNLKLFQYKGADSSHGDTTASIKFKDIQTGETIELTMKDIETNNPYANLILGNDEFNINAASDASPGMDDFDINIECASKIMMLEGIVFNERDYFLIQTNEKNYLLQYKGADSSHGDTTASIKFKDIQTGETIEKYYDIASHTAILNLDGEEFTITGVSEDSAGTDDFDISISEGNVNKVIFSENLPYYDKCTSPYQLKEYYCLDGEILNEYHSCEQGCEEGACKVLDYIEKSVDLQKGWNLVSFPLIISMEDAPEGLEKNPRYVFDNILNNLDKVYSYDVKGWKVWHNPEDNIPSNLDMIKPGKAYWIKMKNPAILYFQGDFAIGDPAMVPTFKVDVGWNLIGVHSSEPIKVKEYLANIDGSYTSLWTTEIIEGESRLKKVHIEENPYLMPSKGYWLYVNEKGEIVP